MTAIDVLPDGWMGKHSRKWLAKRAYKSKRIIEVGAWLGRSTKVLAKWTSGCVWSVDTWEGTPEDPEQHALYADQIAVRDPYVEFCANLAPEIESGKVIPVRARSVDAAAQLLEEHGPVFDFVFIDADHSYEGCAGDIAAYIKLVRSKGVLAGHDYHWPGVKQAVDEWFGDNVKLGPRSLWSIKP